MIEGLRTAISLPISTYANVHSLQTLGAASPVTIRKRILYNAGQADEFFKIQVFYY